MVEYVKINKQALANVMLMLKGASAASVNLPNSKTFVVDGAFIDELHTAILGLIREANENE